MFLNKHLTNKVISHNSYAAIVYVIISKGCFPSFLLHYPIFFSCVLFNISYFVGGISGIRTSKVILGQVKITKGFIFLSSI